MIETEFQYLRSHLEITADHSMLHIGRKGLLESGITHLIPENIRNHEPYDKERAEEDPEYFSVYFCSGKIDPLAKFFAGHALRSDARLGNIPEELEAACNKISSMHENWSIAVAEKEFGTNTGLHELLTLYSDLGTPKDYATEDDYVDVFRVSGKVPINSVISIPRLNFTQKQIDELRDEGQKFYLDRIVNGPEILPYHTEDPALVAEIYQLSRQQELAVKSALLDFLKSVKGQLH